MRIPGACCVWVFLCGSGSRFQFRVRDFRPRTQKVFCGQEFCGFKLTFRSCNFLDVNLFCLEVFCQRSLKFFAEELFKTARTRGKHVLILTISMQTWQFLLKRVWSAGAPRIFAPARTPQKPQVFGKGIFCGAAIQCQATTTSCLIAPPLYLTYLILSRT